MKKYYLIEHDDYHGKYWSFHNDGILARLGIFNFVNENIYTIYGCE
jgi:hypothetical protein